MANKILKFAKSFNRPFVRFVVVNGWNLRLNVKKRKTGRLKRLSQQQKNEVRNYWKRFGKRVNPDWAAYFSYANNIFDSRYIPEGLYYGEIAHKLSMEGMGALHHKNVQDQIFSSKQAKTFIRKTEDIYTDGEYKVIDLEKGLEACKLVGKVIIKPSTGTYGGSGISFWTAEEGIEKLKEQIISYPQVVVQERVQSHPFLNDIHPASLNTLRIVTLLVDNEPVLLSTLLRMGQNNSKVDNYSAGGLIAVVNKYGVLQETAVQSNQKIVTEHPSGFIFKDQKIPCFDKVIEDAFTQHFRIPYFKMVSWDYAIDYEGDPVLIEANIPTGQIDFHQFNIGPIFGDYTDRVLDYVYNGKPL